MKRTPDIPGTGSKSGQVDTTSRESRYVSIISFLLLGASFLVLGALTIWLYRLYLATGGSSPGLIAMTYLSGMLATAVFIGLFALLALRFRTRKALPTSPKVRAALISAIQQDPDPRVRSKAVEGLAELDLEQSSYHHEHTELDDILISTLQRDPDPRVRSTAAEGLTELDLEQSSYHHEHTELDDILFEEGR